ncbi:hypothetical protein E2C01_101240 [Portunus trituberculatus]|uniref:Uncharacterized protein n=1 Tax=Portunus trituberculatus TaxID=210409 RepID=A0A5B7KA56_PORTR|nr:hypothetical protein [Portunus trituberculatus]
MDKREEKEEKEDEERERRMRTRRRSKIVYRFSVCIRRQVFQIDYRDGIRRLSGADGWGGSSNYEAAPVSVVLLRDGSR